MKRFDHLSALKQLLDIDTTLMKEELYYPWYIEKPGMLKVVWGWLALCTTLILLSYIYDLYSLIVTISLIIITIILGTNYIFLIKHKFKHARKQALDQTMALEKKGLYESNPTLYS